MVSKSDPQIGASVDSGDRIIGAGCKDDNSKYQVPSLDASGNLKVNVAAGGAGDGSILDGSDPLIKATVKDLMNSNGVAVAIVDGNGDQITSFGGGTQYTEGDTDASITGTACLMEGAGNALVPMQGTVADGTLVNLGTNNDVTVTSGSITETNSSAIATSLGTIDDWDESDRCKVNPIVGQAGVQGGSGAVSTTTQRVVLATDVALPAGTNAIGKLSANSGVDIGDVDVTSIANGSLNGPGAPTIDSYTRVTLSASANTANQNVISAPGSNKQIWVYGWGGTADTGDGSIAFQDEDDTTVTGVMEVSRRGGFSVSCSGNFAMPIWKIATNKALEIDTVTCGFKGWISYAIVSV